MNLNNLNDLIRESKELRERTFAFSDALLKIKHRMTVEKKEPTEGQVANAKSAAILMNEQAGRLAQAANAF